MHYLKIFFFRSFIQTARNTLPWSITSKEIEITQRNEKQTISFHIFYSLRSGCQSALITAYTDINVFTTWWQHRAAAQPWRPVLRAALHHPARWEVILAADQPRHLEAALQLHPRCCMPKGIWPHCKPFSSQICWSRSVLEGAGALCWGQAAHSALCPKSPCLTPSRCLTPWLGPVGAIRQYTTSATVWEPSPGTRVLWQDTTQHHVIHLVLSRRVHPYC